jgi:hypothetical protein
MEILTNPDVLATEAFADIIEPISRREKKSKTKPVFIVRGPTGRKAEEIYMNHHRATGEPVPGELRDTRDCGCGYDFEILNKHYSIQVEVKGLHGDTGGVSFTSKEWDVAGKSGDSYYLAIVRNVSGKSSIQIIQNPASVLTANKAIFPTVQVRWTVNERELSSLQEG